mmetsp:Transcript_14048/g.21884  ORF Transcript_14048/g.21884 Transcript_14048/m.21884 type:complete len:105 (-) Transcript_14048:719-1033(-)
MQVKIQNQPTTTWYQMALQAQGQANSPGRKKPSSKHSSPKMRIRNSEVVIKKKLTFKKKKSPKRGSFNLPESGSTTKRDAHRAPATKVGFVTSKAGNSSFRHED